MENIKKQKEMPSSPIRDVMNPRAHQEAVCAKERKDVIKSLNSITTTMEGIFDKHEKLDTSPSKERSKLYKKQIKDSTKYLDTLFVALRLEMEESAFEDRILERMEMRAEDSDDTK